jgi:predicted DCC family thiol-disulfide oxidoreductase YuxK
VYTEITDINDIRGWVLYDADCPLFCRFALWARRPLARKHLALAPLQSPWVRQQLDLPHSQLLAEMRLLLPDGKCFGGSDALLQIAKFFWWTWPIRQLARIEIINAGLRVAYRWLARHRACAGGSCAIAITHRRSPPRSIHAAPLILLTAGAISLRTVLPPWQVMWAIALAQYLGFKWITFQSARSLTAPGPVPSRLRLWGYWLAWPGVDATAFFASQSRPARPSRAQWAWALTKLLAGVILFWGVVRMVVHSDPLLAAWVAMAAMVLMLHFGAFELLSLAWRHHGICAKPIMQKPLAATSLAEFWARRWNRAFSDLANHLAFRPLRRLTGAPAAIILTFALSGLVHELVITLPAGGDYGLPTTYFVIQALGILIERSRAGRQWRLGSGLRGRAFVFIFTCGPLPLLFPPVFVHQVVLPMLSSLGAT